MVTRAVNAYERADGKIAVFERDGLATKASLVPAEYVAYFPKDQVPEDIFRMLRSSQHVSSIAADGDARWRVAFREAGSRRAICTHEESPLIRRGIEALEADVSPELRWMVDNNVQPQAPRRCYLDLETDSRVPFSRKEEMRILSWAVVADDPAASSGLHILAEDSNAAERDMIGALWELLGDFDQVCAWNGDGFDFPVLFARSQLAGVQQDPRRILWLDHLELFRRMNMHSAESGEEKQSMRLEDIAQIVLGQGKQTEGGIVPGKALGAQTWEMWSAGGEYRKNLGRYNYVDTELLARLEKKTGYVDLLGKLCDACGIFPNSQGINPTRQMDGFMLRLGAKRGIRFPTRKHQSDAEKFKGAYVMKPRARGIEREVHVCDFSSLYPSIILTFNMSPETKRLINVNGPVPAGHCRAPKTGVGFSTEVHGLLVEALKDLLQLRKYWNDLKASLPPGTPEWVDADRRSNAYKVAANSFYGLLGSIYSRFYDKGIAESITQTGAWLIERVIDEIEARDWRAIYGDTDSAFATGCTKEEFTEFVAWCNKEFFPRILKEQGCAENHIKLAFEKTFERLVMVGAKRYCNPPEAPILMGDFTFKKLGDVKVGDVVMGWEEGSSRRKRHLVASQVVALHQHRAPIVKVTMKSGKTIRCTEDHQWLRARRLEVKRGPKVYDYPWCTVKKGRRLVRVLDEPEELHPDLQRDADWLGGIFDGEGSLASDLRNQIVISQSRRVNPEVCDRIEMALTNLGFDYSVGEEKSGACNRFNIKGGKQARLNFLTWCRPAKRRQIVEGMKRSFFGNPGDEIVSIEPDGRGLVIGMTTTSGNYVAWGYASKNCGKYAQYKGKAATADSKPEIKGLEYKRGDSALLARRLQKDVIDMVMRGSEVADHYRVMVEAAREHVLRDPLPLEEVQLSKAITKPLGSYASKVKNDGTAAAQPPHVAVAKILKERGEEVGEGTRINYVVTDGSGTHKVIPASDYDGTNVDRYYIWEDLVYPATLGLLDAAFPDEQWNAYEKVRPRKLRGKSKVLEGQQALGGLDPLPLPPPHAGAECVVEVPGNVSLKELKKLLLNHPGQRRLVIRLLLPNGAQADVATAMAVSGSQAMIDEVRQLFVPAA